GTFGSNGDGTDATSASIADPDTILVDQNNVYFTEFSTGRVRKVLNNAVSTVLDLSRFNVPIGSHALLLDSFGRLLLANPTGLLRFDGARVQTVTAYPMSDPYFMVSDSTGNIYVSDRVAHQILRFTPAGSVSVYAGIGTPGFGGDGSRATA